MPPAASTRSRSPVRPLPALAIPPRPLSSMVIQCRAERDRAAAGPGVAHYVGHAFPNDPTEHLVQPRVDDIDSAWQFGLHSGRSEYLMGARQLADQRHVSISRYRRADIRERAAAQAAPPRPSPGRRAPDRARPVVWRDQL